MRSIGLALFAALISVMGSLNSHAQLKSPTNSGDYLIVHPAVFAAPAAEHALWRKGQGREARAVALEDVIAEFPAATSAESLRDFLSYALTSWTPPRPSSVLLLGDVELIPSWPMFFSGVPITDTAMTDWPFVINKNHNDIIPDAAIGRMPVRTLAEASDCLAKTRLFEDAFQPMATAQDYLLLTDDKDGESFEAAAASLAPFPSQSRVRTVSLRPGSPQHGDRAAAWSTLAQGTHVLLYFGHAGANVWSAHRLLAVDNLDSAGLHAVPFFFVSAGGGQSFDQPQRTLIEELLLRAQGGAVASIASSGQIWFSMSMLMMNRYWADLWTRKASAGESLLRVLEQESDPILQRFTLLGDPALRIPSWVIAGTGAGEALPDVFHVDVYPNPVQGLARFALQVPEAADISIDVYNTLGMRVARITPGRVLQGTRIATWDVSALPRGLYHYRATAGAHHAEGSVLLVK